MAARECGYLCGVAIVSAFTPSFNTIRVKIIDAIWSS
jgi:hypothetical protein